MSMTMSQTPHENIDVPNPAPTTVPALAADEGNLQYPPPSAQNQESKGISDHVDSSGPIFSLYLEMASEEDKKMAESWKDDADGILIFTGLFSAAVASLISVSIQDLRQNPQDTSNFYLANMYQATINPNASSSLPPSPPPFTPPNYAIWVNTLWFLSLVISITCALLATLLQQWARRYLKVTQPRYSPHKRARIRAFFAEGVDKFLLPWAVEALPTMLHLSLFLFFGGLAVFLWNVNLTVFKFALSWIGFCTALYGCITIIPVFCHDSPYHTPLSLPVWHFVMGIRFLAFRTFECITSCICCCCCICCFTDTYFSIQALAEDYRKPLVRGMHKAVEESAFNSPPRIDTRAFMWTFDCLDEDHELERFFAGLPGFRKSKMVKDPLLKLTLKQQEKLVNALIGLSDRTYSSDLLPEQVKMRRSVICQKAIDSTGIPAAIWHALNRVTYEYEFGPVQSAEIADLVRGWDDGKDEEITMVSRILVSAVVARAQQRNDLWFTMASNEMGVSESVLRNYATHGNNLSLAILNYTIRQHFIFFERGDPLLCADAFFRVLDAASKFDALDTLPELQHDFCELWNQVIHSHFYYYIRFPILSRIRNIYLALHLHTDCAPTEFDSTSDTVPWRLEAFPVCTIPGHRPHPATDVHDPSASTATPRPALPDSTAPGPTFPPDVPPPSVITPVLVVENTVDITQLVLPPSSHAHQTATGDFHDSATSPDPAAALAARDNSSVQTMGPTIHAASTPTLSVPPPSEVSFQNNTDLQGSHSGSPEIPPSTSPEPVLENIRPTESHSPVIASMSPGTSPRPTSTPGLVAATSGVGSPKASSCEDKDALDFPSEGQESQATTQAIADVLPQLLPLPSVTDISTASLSQQEFDA